MVNYNSFSILLSASSPAKERSKKYQEEYTKVANAQMQVEEAVVALCRNVFSSQGNIIMGGHPSISPLMVMVASEFDLDRDVENIEKTKEKTLSKPITIFQSRAYEAEIGEASRQLFDLGYVNPVWTNALNGEKYNRELKGKPQCIDSLGFMRKRMIERHADAMVCIGGMEGVEVEFDMFRSLNKEKPIYLLASTGGATKILANEYGGEKNIRIVENDIKYFTHIEDHLKTDESFQKDKMKADPEDIEKRGRKFELIPYSYITARIVQEVINGKK